MKEPFFSKSPHGPPLGSHQNNKDYTYFDSATRKYLDRHRKNEQKREQEEQLRQKQQLKQCTFRPILTSQQYYEATKKTHPKPTTANPYSQALPNKKQQPYVRLLNWHHRRQTEQRSKLIQREVAEMVHRQSLSIQRRKRSPRARGEQEKMDRSLQETFRSEQSSSVHFGSINAVQVLSHEEMEGESQPPLQSYYQTFQSSKRRK